MLLFTFLLFGACYASAEKMRFDDYKVYRIYPATEDMNNVLLSMQEDLRYTFWSDPSSPGGKVDISVAPEHQAAFEELMNLNGMGAQVFIENLQARMDMEYMSDATKAPINWTQYWNLAAIHSWLDDLAAANPSVETIVAGKSHENRDVKGVKISYGAGRKVIMIEGGIHAREWISPATVTYIINELLTSTDPKVRRMAEGYDWILFPSTNPDGYQFSIDTNRQWRKTRTPYAGGCFGADPNRNWDFTWGVHGSSVSSCSDTYRGPNPFSEKSVVALKSVIDANAARMDMYIAMHSYGQYLMLPYGNSTEHLGNYNDLLTMARAAALSLQLKYGTRYTVGNTAEVLYRASGTSADWVNDHHKVPVTYTYEFRDTGRYGFVLPADQIIPNCEEVMASLVTLFDEGERLGYFNVGSVKGEPLSV